MIKIGQDFKDPSVTSIVGSAGATAGGSSSSLPSVEFVTSGMSVHIPISSLRIDAISISDAKGRMVRSFTLSSDLTIDRETVVRWNGFNRSGTAVRPGTYIVNVVAGARRFSKTFILTK
jgi:flagellar hook assembly protein FlgD